MKKIVAAFLLFFSVSHAAFAQSTPDPISNLPAAGALADTDTLAVCQLSTGCVLGVQLKKITPLQLSTYIGSKGYLINPSVALTGTPTAPTAAQGTNSTQIATTAFVKLQQDTPPTASWLVGASPNNGVLVGRVGQALNVAAIWCRPTVSGDSGATVDVYSAPSGTGGASGTKLTTTSCNPNSTVNIDQNLLSAPTTVPANNTVYLVTANSFANSAGSISMQITNQ